MKHILLCVLLGCTSVLCAQNGRVYRPNGAFFDQPVTVHVEVDGCPQYSSDQDFPTGEFTLQLTIDPGSGCDSVRIGISAEGKPRDGISTLDLLRLMRYLLGQKPFTTLLERYAADVNNSQSVSALDLVEIRKLILGHYVEWPKNTTYRFFVRKSPVTPPLNTYLPGKYAIANGAPPGALDFWVVQVGEFGQF